jgi:hypothetical protein
LKGQLTQATQTAFNEVIAQHRDEGVYSFALYSDEGAMTVCPAINTLAHLATQPTDDLPYAKFEPAEWRYENVGATSQFDAIRRQLRTQVLNEALEEEEFEQFRQQLYATCIDVLEDLQQQGFFDRAAGQAVFLLFHISDSDTSAEKLTQPVSRLNSNAYGDEYLAWLRT